MSFQDKVWSKSLQKTTIFLRFITFCPQGKIVPKTAVTAPQYLRIKKCSQIQSAF